MSGPGRPSLAECIAVTRTFGGLAAVSGVDLRLGPGEVIGLLGANGAGKTTLIRLLLGLLRPSAGGVHLFGAPPSRAGRRRLGYLPQGLGLYRDLTAAENRQFAAAVFGVGDRLPARPDRYDSTPVGRLPLGIQRRAAFRQVLAHRPELLILDEPTSGVDPLGRSRLWEMIADAAGRGAGVLVTTHYMEEARECQRLMIMSSGRVVAEGTAAGIIGGARVTVVEAGRWADAFAALDGAGLQVALAGRSLRVPGASPVRVRRVLGDIVARVSDAPATLEERFFELSATT
jgi:ABC-2 type transport system ATP-binding protein